MKEYVEDLYEDDLRGEYIEPQVDEGTKIETSKKTRNDRMKKGEAAGTMGLQWTCKGR